MVVIRLARHGSIHKPFYHVTVADRRARRDGTFIERIGFYNPIAKGKAERLRIDLARVDYWVGQGAQTSETVSRLVKEARRADQIGPTEEADQPEAIVESVETETPESASDAPVEASASDDSPAEAVAEASTAEVKSDEDTVEAVATDTAAEDDAAEEADVAEAAGSEADAVAEAATPVEDAPATDSDVSADAATDKSESSEEKPAT